MKNFHQHNRNDKRPFGGRDSGKRSMHRATCDECGQDCEVPFKPSGDKPIYCSNCFGKNKSSDYGRWLLQARANCKFERKRGRGDKRDKYSKCGSC